MRDRLRPRFLALNILNISSLFRTLYVDASLFSTYLNDKKWQCSLPLEIFKRKGYLFVDAGLPHPGQSQLDKMEASIPAFVQELRRHLASGGSYPNRG
jgi:hypothetical protein